MLFGFLVRATDPVAALALKNRCQRLIQRLLNSMAWLETRLLCLALEAKSGAPHIKVVGWIVAVAYYLAVGSCFATPQ